MPAQEGEEKMPTYDFKCNKCTEKFELKLSISERDSDDSSIKKCPKCESKDIKQVISFTGFASSGSSSAGGGCNSTGFG